VCFDVRYTPASKSTRLNSKNSPNTTQHYGEINTDAQRVNTQASGFGSERRTMKLNLAAIMAVATPILAQSVTPAPTTTNNNNWGPPWAPSNIPKWSSIYNGLVSDGFIPSTLTAAPWPTDGYGPGAGWGPGGGNRGPGGQWGGMSTHDPSLSRLLLHVLHFSPELHVI
jgi:hypothetical protein